jgi:Family of unknown function (DUF6644)
LLPFFQWCDATTIGAWIRDSTWLFPLIETFHILALTVLFGTVLVIDLRLMGAGLRAQPVSVIARQLRPWLRGSLAVILASGVLLFLSEAMKCYGNDGFRFKMVALFLALGFQFTVFAYVTSPAGEARVWPVGKKMAALVSMALWLSVGIGGRAIGFV